MSVEYDDKIVRMQFDNKGFESGIQTTLHSLEQLKASLKFNNVVTGIDEMGASLKNLSLDNLTTGVEQCIVKIPVMGTVLDQTIRNMTNSVESFIKSTLDKFSILGNAKSGFGEYELQIGAVKTIKASTGEDVATINKYLEDLNKYADDTIYSFSDMTQNIGKFTNAGVKLEDSVNAIKGVANVAALSGANTQEASRAMYNFAQALSAGSVKLIDWKSIENANMATVEFKNELIKTGLELGTLRQEGDKYVTTTTDLQGKVSQAFDATSNFNDALSHQWMTTDVLVKTLNKYTDTTTEIGQKATEAATKVNTFHQAMDAIVEDLGSNWTESWKYIVGDFEEATKMWTSFKDAISSIFKPAAEARNKMLKFWSTGEEEGEKAVELTEEAKKKYQELFDVAKKGYMGDYGNGADRVRALTEAGYDYAEVQAIINGLVDGSVKSWEDVAKAAETANEAQSKGMTGREMFLKGINNLWQSIRDVMWAVSTAWHEVFPRTTGQQLVAMSKAFMEFTEKLRMSGKTVNELRRTLRGLFALLDIGLMLVKAVLKGIGALVSGILSGLGKSDKGILTLTANIGDIIFKIDQLIKESKIFEAVFVGIGKIIGSVGGAILSIIAAIIGAIAGLLKALFGLGKDTIDMSGITDSFSTAATDVSTFTSFIAEKVASFALIPVTGITTFANKVADSFSIFGKATMFFSKIADVFVKVWDKVKKVFQVIGALLSPLVDAIKNKLGDLMGGAYSFEDFIKFLKEGGGLILLGELITLIHTIKKTIGSGRSVGKSMAKMFDSIGDSAKALTQKVKAQALMQIALAIGVMVAAVYFLSRMDPVALATGLGALTLLMLELNGTLKKMNTAILAGTAGSLIAIGIAVILLTTALKKLAKMKPEDVYVGLAFLGLLLKELTTAVNNFKKVDGNTDKVARVLLSLAVTITILMIPLQILGRTNSDVLWQGVGFLTLLLVELVGIMFLFKVIGRVGGSLNKVSRVLLILAVTITLLIPPLLLLSFLPVKRMNQGLKGLGIMLLELAAAMLIMSAFQIGDNTVKTMALMSVLVFELFYIVGALGKMDSGDLTQGEIALGLMVGLVIIMAYILGEALSKIDYKTMLAAFGGIIAVIAVMTAILLALGKLSKEKQWGAIIGLVAVVILVAVLAAVITGLAKAFSNPKVVTGAAAMSAAMLSLGASILMVGAGMLLLIAAIDYLNRMEIDSSLLDKFAIVAAGILLCVENMVGGVIGAIIGAVPAIVNGALSVIDLILEGLDDNITSIIGHITSILDAILSAVADYAPTATQHFIDFVSGILDTMANNANQISEWAYDLSVIIAAIIDGLADGIEPVGNAIIGYIQELTKWLTDNKDDIVTAIGDFCKAVWDVVWGILEKYIVDPLAEFGVKAAAHITKGVIDGLNGLIAAICSLFDGAVNAIIDVLNELSWDIPDWVPGFGGKHFGFDFDPVKTDPFQIGYPDFVNAVLAAKGATYNPRNAIVGEAGPELLSSVNGRSVVTPLSNQNARSTTKAMMERYTSDISKQLDNINGTMSQINQNGIDNAYDDTAIRKEVTSVNDTLNELKEDILGIQLVLDTGVLAGELAKPMDQQLGRRNKFATRRTGAIKAR